VPTSSGEQRKPSVGAFAVKDPLFFFGHSLPAGVGWRGVVAIMDLPTVEPCPGFFSPGALVPPVVAVDNGVFVIVKIAHFFLKVKTPLEVGFVHFLPLGVPDNERVRVGV